MSSQLKDSNMYSEPMRSSSSGISYSIELKDAYIPPWVVSGVCDAICSNGGDFQARYPGLPFHMFACQVKPFCNAHLWLLP